MLFFYTNKYIVCLYVEIFSRNTRDQIIVIHSNLNGLHKYNIEGVGGQVPDIEFGSGQITF